MPERATLIALAIATLIAGSGALAAFAALPLDWLRPLRALLAPAPHPPPAEADLQARLIELSAENALLRQRLRQYQEIAGESGLPPARAVAARGAIVGRSQRLGRRFLEIAAGSADGVERGAAVVDGWRLAGVVAGLRERRALVQELADSESRIPALIIGPDGPLAEGVLAGTGDPALASLDLVEDREGRRIEPGMAVVSAAQAALPYGLAIGRIRSALRPGDGGHWQITVELAADSARADSLLVLRRRLPPPEAP